MRSLPRGAETPIVAVTASAFEENRRGAIEAGADDFLGKPFREADLFEMIGRLAGVRFFYAEEMAMPPAAGPGAPLSREQLEAALPATLRTRLHEAAIRADYTELLALLDEAGPEASEVVAHLRDRVEHFDYQSLLSISEPEIVKA